MKKNLTLILFSILCLRTFAQLPAIPPDSTFYYLPDGSKSWWYVQKDMASFRLMNGVAYTGTQPTYLDTVKHMPSTTRKQNLIKFKSTATIMQKAMFINSVSTATNYEWFAPVVSQVNNLPYTSDQWVNTADLILVKFKNVNLTQTDIVNFMSRNNLTLDHQPSSSLPTPNSWTFIFKINKDSKGKPYGDVFSVCQYIFVNEAGYVTHCEPGMYLYKPTVCTLPNEFTAWGSTSYPDALWHIRNQGNNVNIATGIAGADAKICECWGDGYHGENIKVAVIDGGGYDYNLPDMVGQYLPGFDCISNTPFSTTTFPNNVVHGMSVASVIGAIENGGQTSAQPINASAVGVAYKSKIIPYITDFSNFSVTKAIQRVVLDGADVVNMSFGYEDNSSSTMQSAFYSDILAATQLGRGGLGIVFVASTGNENKDVKEWPAADNVVLGVGATDPNDFRGSYQQTPEPWLWQNISNQKGSNYLTVNATNNIHYDVVAPGTSIRIAYTANGTSSPVHTESEATGTSFSAPVVSGIAAILLSKYPTMSFQAVINSINNNADKIRTSTYNYSQFSFLPSYAKETFYGRINCINTLLNPAVGIKENVKLSDEIKLAYLDYNEASILFNKNTNNKGFILSVYDIGGRLISKKQIEANLTTYSINTEGFTKGVYLFKLNSLDNNADKTFKYIK
ncbi:MAG: S8 family serine peptidase [Bacteroidetes bacterium]|nr:S8 family serine peptidase [Bacteroidota bacterium]